MYTWMHTKYASSVLVHLLILMNYTLMNYCSHQEKQYFYPIHQLAIKILNLHQIHFRYIHIYHDQHS